MWLCTGLGRFCMYVAPCARDLGYMYVAPCAKGLGLQQASSILFFPSHVSHLNIHYFGKLLYLIRILVGFFVH